MMPWSFAVAPLTYDGMPSATKMAFGELVVGLDM